MAMTPSVSLTTLVTALGNSPEIRARLQDVTFAQHLYSALCNTDLYYQDDPTPVGCSWRTAGGIVADLRDQNEDYVDFYCSDVAGVVYPEIAEALATIGWRAVPIEEDESFFSLPPA